MMMMIKVVASGAGLLATGMAFAASIATTNKAPEQQLSIVSAPVTALTSSASTTTSTVQWMDCAREGQTCSVSGTVLVRYGVGNTFVTKEVAGPFTCGNGLFGDPAYGVAKACSYTAAPVVDQWVVCAVEGQTCVLPGSARVRYGALDKFATRDATDRVSCGNGVFGDPIPGVIKSCYYALAAPADQWITCASEGQTCAVSRPTQVRYGARGTFLVKEASSQIACSNVIFGDPLQGVVKSCAFRATPATSAPAPSGLSGVLDEGDSISVFWGGNHTGIYAAAHPNVAYHGQAVGGSNLQRSGNDLAARFDADAALRPAYVTILVGANDLGEVGLNWAQFTTTQAYLDALFAYVAKWKATGAKVALGTILPQCRPGNPNGINDRVNANRAVVNAAIRAAAGAKIDAVIDYAADPDLGLDAAACNTTWYQDGLHPTDGSSSYAGGQGRMALIYAKTLDQLMK